MNVPGLSERTLERDFAAGSMSTGAELQASELMQLPVRVEF